MKTVERIHAEIAELKALAKKYPDDHAVQASVEAQIDALSWAICFEAA